MKLGTRRDSAAALIDAPALRRQPAAIAHRGASCMAPENTLLAFQLALEAGVDAIETDARLTADGDIVLLHDADLARTTDGLGLVSSHTLAEIRSLDAGYWFSSRCISGHAFRDLGLGVPTLAELFALLDRLAPHVTVHLEIKNAPDDLNYDSSEGLADTVASWLHGHDAQARAVVSSFNPATIDRVKHVAPQLRTAYLATGGTDLHAKLAYVVAHCHDALHPRHDLLDADRASLRVLAAAHAAGVAVNVWTVNEPVRMRELLALGVDGVMSDDPQRLCATLDTTGAACA